MKSSYYVVSAKVQFPCLTIGQNRITCWSTKRHVHCMLWGQPVNNETIIDRSTKTGSEARAAYVNQKVQSKVFSRVSVGFIRVSEYQRNY